MVCLASPLNINSNEVLCHFKTVPDDLEENLFLEKLIIDRDFKHADILDPELRQDLEVI